MLVLSGAHLELQPDVGRRLPVAALVLDLGERHDREDAREALVRYAELLRDVLQLWFRGQNGVRTDVEPLPRQYEGYQRFPGEYCHLKLTGKYSGGSRFDRATAPKKSPPGGPPEPVPGRGACLSRRT